MLINWDFSSLDNVIYRKIGRHGSLSSDEIVYVLSSIFDNDFFSQRMVNIYKEVYKSNPIMADKFFNSFFYRLDFCTLYKDCIYLTETVNNHYRGKIKVSKDSDDWAWIHELSHLLDYHYRHGIVPGIFEFLKDYTVKNNGSNFVWFLNRLDADLLKTTKETTIEFVENSKKNGTFISVVDLSVEEIFSLLCKLYPNYLLKKNVSNNLSDIIDALFGGESYDRGLKYFTNLNELPISAGRTSGHGSSYYENASNFVLCEIIANYLTLCLFAPNDEYFKMLKVLLGDSFVDILDEMCLNIVSCNDFDSLAISVNGIKKNDR